MTDTKPDLGESELQLKRDLAPFFAELEARMVPEQIITGVHSSGYAENGDFLLMLDCADGGMMFIAVTPGEPLRIVVQPHPQ